MLEPQGLSQEEIKALANGVPADGMPEMASLLSPIEAPTPERLQLQIMNLETEIQRLEKTIDYCLRRITRHDN